MRTLAPSQTFLRVADKFFARHALFDRELKPGATLLYLYLYAMCAKQDRCWPSQASMAEACKASERSVQQYLKELVRLEYIRVERQGKNNVYYLLASTRVLELAEVAGMDLVCSVQDVGIGEKPAPNISIQTKILHKIGADSAYDLRSSLRNKNNTPLSPLPQTIPGTPPRRWGCSPRSPLPRSGSGGTSLGAESDGAAARSTCHVSRQAQDEFVQLWQAWPLKQDRYESFREFGKQLSAGVLPKLDELLITVARLKSENRCWIKGYIPNLKFWLRGRRWEDEISSSGQQDAAVLLSNSSALSLSVPTAFAEPCVIEPVRLALRPDQEFFDRTVDHLGALWPHIPTGCLRAGLFLAKTQMATFTDKVLPFFSGVFAPASLSGTMPAPNPQAIACWVREAVA